MQKQNNGFDFNSSISNITEEKKAKAQAEKSARNKKVGAVVATVAVLGGVGYMIDHNIQQNRDQIDSSIAEATKNNSEIDTVIKELEKRESELRVMKSALEVKMNRGFAQKEAAINLMAMEKEIDILYKKLNNAQVKDARLLNNDIKELTALKAAMTSSDYDQKEAVISSDIFKKWADYSKNLKDKKVVSDLPSFTEVEKEYVEKMNEILVFEKQYIQVLKEVIASGKYSLSSSQSEIMSSIAMEGRELSREFDQLYLDNQEASKALKAENLSDEGIATAFTTTDLAEANEGVKEMENAALAQAIADRKKVEEIIARAQNGESVEQMLGMTGEIPTEVPPAIAPTSTPAPTSTASSGGGSSMMPFLMGMWLGNAFSSSPSYNNYSNGYNQGYNNAKKEESRSGYAGGGGAAAASRSASSTPATNSSRFNTAVASTKASEAYSFRKQDSYLNKTASNSSRALGSSSFEKAKSTLSRAQTSANRAQSLRNTAFRKAGIAQGTRASNIRMAVSQNRAAAVARASQSASSRGGMAGARGMSSGG